VASEAQSQFNTDAQAMWTGNDSATDGASNQSFGSTLEYACAAGTTSPTGYDRVTFTCGGNGTFETRDTPCTGRWSHSYPSPTHPHAPST
jgi:hypothetical protein